MRPTRRVATAATAAAAPSPPSFRAAQQYQPPPMAAYPNAGLVRGTAGLYTSRHFESVRTHYDKRRLRASFWGPGEWHVLSRRRQERMKLRRSSVVPADFMRQQQPSTDQHLMGAYPDTHPRAADDQERRDTWRQFRHACAHVHPHSVFAREERVMDAWNLLCDNQPTCAQHGSVARRHGLTISLRDHYAHPYQPPMEKPAGASDGMYQAYLLLHSHSNPFREDANEPLPVDFLQQVVAHGVSTGADAAQLLPAMVQRWRWLAMGEMHRVAYETPDTALTAHILARCREFDAADSALEMLRHKAAYKLAPTVTSVEALMEALLERHVRIAKQQPDSTVAPAQPTPYTPDPQLTKRRMSADTYPFRGVPRLYFYQPLPAVLWPEPSATSDEIPLPQLPRDNATRRLLPYDQRKKLHMMQETARLQFAGSAVLESPAVASLTDLYRLFHYATSQQPAYYGLPATATMHSLLLRAGVMGGTAEGVARSHILRDASNGSTAADGAPSD